MADQYDLFGNRVDAELWKDEWKDMPEYEQKKGGEYCKIIFRFSCEEDLDDFSKKIGQKLKKSTRFTWHPALPKGFDSAKQRRNYE